MTLLISAIVCGSRDGAGSAEPGAVDGAGEVDAPAEADGAADSDGSALADGASEGAMEALGSGVGVGAGVGAGVGVVAGDGVGVGFGVGFGLGFVVAVGRGVLDASASCVGVGEAAGPLAPGRRKTNQPSAAEMSAMASTATTRATGEREGRGGCEPEGDRAP
jgi:hypothetical protein